MEKYSDLDSELSFKHYFVPLTTLKAINIIIIVGIFVFFNMLFNGFVWDDKTYILDNPLTHTGSFLQLVGNNIFNSAGQYRPLPAIYFSIFYHVFGETPFPYHFFQLVLHILNAALLYVIFKTFFNKKLALIISLIFLIHPIQVESVSYIGAVASPLFFLFGICALILSTTAKIGYKKYILISTLLLLSLLTKESGILFAFIVVAYFLIFKKEDIARIGIVGIITVLSYFLFRFGIGAVYFAKLPLIPIAQLTLVERLVNLPAIIFYYLKTIFFPINLFIDQQWVIRKVNFQNFYLPLLFDILFFSLISIFGIYLYKKNNKEFKKYLFFVLWFIGGLMLYSQIFPIDGTVADRWFYFPIVGLLGIFSVAISFIKASKQYVKLIYLFVGICIILLSIRTVIRNSNWYDGITLYSHDIKTYDNYNLETNLGWEYQLTGNYSMALSHYHKSVEFLPYEGSYFNVGTMYMQIGNSKKAEEYYYKALASKSYISGPHNHNLTTYQQLALVLIANKDFKSAREIAKKGIEDYPNNGNLWLELAISEYRMNNQQEALSAADKSRTLLPNQQTQGIYTKILNKEPIQITN